MKKSEGETQSRIGFLNRTGMYGFELFMALFGLVTTLIVLDYGIFALCNYLRGMNQVGTFVGEFTIWIIAAMIVWLPVTLIFYLRSRAESERNSAVTLTMLHRTLLSIYYFSVIIGAIGLLFGALYFLVRMALSPDDSSLDSFIRIVLPALISVVVHIGMLFALTKAKRPSRRLFAGVFGVFALLVTVALFVFSASFIRASKQDDTTVMDLNNVQSTLTVYYTEHQTLPKSLQDVSFSQQDIAGRLNKYAYTAVDAERYELCADFATDNTYHYSAPNVPVSSYETGTADDYQMYPSFYYHTKGHECFKLRVYDDKLVSPAATNNF